MSYSRNQKRKKARKARTTEEKNVSRQIRKGILPKYYLAKQQVGYNACETAPHHRVKAWIQRTWRLVSTFLELTKK